MEMTGSRASGWWRSDLDLHRSRQKPTTSEQWTAHGLTRSIRNSCELKRDEIDDEAKHKAVHQRRPRQLGQGRSLWLRKQQQRLSGSPPSHIATAALG
jgi:hypothetical protein